jgi:hypothetical protein
MNSENNGKSISEFWLGFGEREEHYKANQNEAKFVYQFDYHGDHSLEWILVIRDGVETGRFNMMFVSAITWDNAERPRNETQTNQQIVPE